MPQLLTLDDVVKAGQEGRDDRQKQVQYQRGLQQQQIGDGANARASEVFQKHMQSTGDRDVAMLKATEAFGMHFAENGQWQDYAKHSAALTPQRIRVMSDALRQYAVDKDPKKLILKSHAAMPDGTDIEGFEELEGGPPVDRGTAPTAVKPAAPKTLAQGMADFDTANTNPLGVRAAPEQEGLEGIVQPGRPGDGRLGAPSGPASIRVKLSNGEVRPVDVNQLAKGLQQALVDPQKAAEKLMELDFITAKERVATQGRVAVERVKGEEGRRTETVKGGFQRDRDERQANNQRTLAGLNNDAAMKRTQTSASATTSAASIRASGGGGGGGGKGDDGEIKTLAQANRAVETARNALNQATTAASKIRLEGRDGMRWTGAERAAEVDKDPEVAAARAEYQRSLAVRNQLAKGEKPGAPAKPAGSRSNLFEVIR